MFNHVLNPTRASFFVLHDVGAPLFWSAQVYSCCWNCHSCASGAIPAPHTPHVWIHLAVAPPSFCQDTWRALVACALTNSTYATPRTVLPPECCMTQTRASHLGASAFNSQLSRRSTRRSAACPEKQGVVEQAASAPRVIKPAPVRPSNALVKSLFAPLAIPEPH